MTYQAVVDPFGRGLLLGFFLDGDGPDVLNDAARFRGISIQQTLPDRKEFDDLTSRRIMLVTLPAIPALPFRQGVLLHL